VNPRLIKLKNKKLIYFVSFILLVLSLSLLVPTLRPPILSTLKYPLNLLTLIRREASGIIFYHRHLVQNERLKKEIDLLKHKFNTTNEIYLENIRLKKLLSFKQKSHFKVIAARVIGHSVDNWSSVVIIDNGGYDGIKRGMVAISYSGLVGCVVEVNPATSKIMLINDPSFSVSAIVQRSRQEGLVSGTLGNSLIMKYLPKEADIEISDVVVTSGLTGMYPKGLIIGTVVDMGEEFSGLSRYCRIKPAVDLSNIEEVLIIIP